MARRRRRRLLLLLGAAGALAGLFDEWLSLDAGLLGTLGLFDAERVRGHEIVPLVAEAGGNPLVQAGRAVGEAFSGRLDLAAARLLFGERYEEDWAPLVFAPAAFCLLGLLVLRFPRAHGLARLLGVAGVLLLLGMALFVIDVEAGLIGEAGGLRLHRGVWLTAAAVALSTAGCVLAARTIPRRRRKRLRRSGPGDR